MRWAAQMALGLGVTPAWTIFAAVEGKNHEDVEDAEPPGHEDEEVAGPGLAEVIADERGPALSSLPVQASRAVLGGRARRDDVAQLGKLGRDDLLSPGRVLAPHPADESPKVGVNRRPARWTTRTPSPKEAPRGTVPTDDGLRFHEQDGVEQPSAAARQGAEKPSIEAAETRALDPATGHDELLPEEQVLGDQGRAGSHDG